MKTLLRLILVGLFAFPSVPAFSQAAVGLTPCTTTAVTGKTSLSVTTVSARVQLSNCGPTVILYNIGTIEAFYALGSSTVTATTTGFSIPPNFYVILNIGSSSPYLAAVTSSDSTTIRIVQGRAQ
jgi:hypothetical protein